MRRLIDMHTHMFRPRRLSEESVRETKLMRPSAVSLETPPGQLGEAMDPVERAVVQTTRALRSGVNASGDVLPIMFRQICRIWVGS